MALHTSRPQYRDYDEYWRAYLAAHSKPATRLCHYLATAQGFGFGLAALVLCNPWLIIPAFVLGYGTAVGSHFVFQKNRPLVSRPLWGWRSDLRMCWLALTGRLGAEYQRLGISAS
jgi:hypothetical protein